MVGCIKLGMGAFCAPTFGQRSPPFVKIHSEAMPIFDYKCRKCGERFELLVLKATVAACPSCHSQELDQQISTFGVSSEATRQSHLHAARRKYASSNDVKDKKIAEIQEIREHAPDFGAQKKKP